MKKLGAIILSIAFASPAMADDGWTVYLGADTVDSTFAVSSDQVIFTGDNEAAFRNTDDFESKFNRLRLGVRLSESVGLEGHFGLEDDAADATAGTVAVEEYYGLYLVPTATVMDLFELAFPVGFSQVTVAGTDTKYDADGIAYGMNAELPLSRFIDIESWDLRLVAGGMVYQQDGSSRLYGVNFGLRGDFSF